MTKLFQEFIDTEVRDEVPQEKSPLEIILEVEEKIIEKYKNAKRGYKSDKEEPFYINIRRDTKKQLQRIQLSSEILQTYLDARENTEQNQESEVRGVYSGVLLELACENELSVSLNGKGRMWKYLFTHVKKAKNVTLENIQGDFMILYAGSYGGHIENILVKNSINCNHLLDGVGSERGFAKNIHIENIQGYGTLMDAASYSGHVENVCVRKIKGYRTLYSAACWNGEIKNIIVTDIIGNDSLAGLASDKGLAKNIVVGNIQGHCTLMGLVEDGHTQGVLENITIVDITGSNTLARSGVKGKIKNRYRA